MRDIIGKYNLQTDDVLKRMKLTRSQFHINFLELKEALKNLDPNLIEGAAVKLANYIITINYNKISYLKLDL